ncbi:MAG: phospho-N-acetylmuramoyl-pentapeptide-transferase [Candidatus Gastranaerophilales bacterium]|nr:phospho-N-acetylmuramoyl-pentapeptide-transferase [Candidatus Gastranaerophilales bacterium]
MIMISVAGLIALILCLLFGIPYINFMKKKAYSQYLREEVAQMHAYKEKTPTTGGVFIIASIILASIVALFMAQKATTGAIIVLMTLIFYTFTGFEDDIKKIKAQQNLGLSARAKLMLQIAVAMLPAFYIIFSNQTAVSFLNFSIDLGWFYPVFVAFMIVGASNAVNLTDGLDGLAASSSVIAFLACSVICFLNNNIDLAIISIAASASCLGFLYFNKKPAKIFMGDTGSLALGGLLATIAIMGKFELWLIPIAIVFICETLSVMIQVTSFKLTGKRVFKMSPIHHHFELSNWSENKIVVVFSLITLISSTIATVVYYLYKA